MEKLNALKINTQIDIKLEKLFNYANHSSFMNTHRNKKKYTFMQNNAVIGKVIRRNRVESKTRKIYAPLPYNDSGSSSSRLCGILGSLSKTKAKFK